MGLIGVIFGNLFALSVAVTALSFFADFFSGEPSSGQVYSYGFMASIVLFGLLIVANVWRL